MQSTKNIHTQKKKTMETRIIKNISNKNERRCRDVCQNPKSIQTRLGGT